MRTGKQDKKEKEKKEEEEEEEEEDGAGRPPAARQMAVTMRRSSRAAQVRPLAHSSLLAVKIRHSTATPATSLTQPRHTPAIHQLQPKSTIEIPFPLLRQYNILHASTTSLPHFHPPSLFSFLIPTTLLTSCCFSSSRHTKQCFDYNLRTGTRIPYTSIISLHFQLPLPHCSYSCHISSFLPFTKTEEDQNNTRDSTSYFNAAYSIQHTNQSPSHTHQATPTQPHSSHL
ncbi:hypothetical protein E2C01_092203 [Portunus trituberculatus]|uniref:Uncharacterized protein n=1 Tax=Portunus trituberculatus TaxID=210409 RepID=A0A5B7JL55_PORTR|nr:hypothetical protein [Portunus trituberculatus]